MPEYPISKLERIPYNSPSGFVNVGKYIPPFEKVKNGFGFMGVVVEDSESGKLQCHVCGEWFGVFNSHLSKHRINSSQYKEIFGLSQSTALKSKKVRLKQSEVMSKLRRSHMKYNTKFKRNNSYAGNRKNKPKSLETINKFGICDLQITHKILELKDKLNKTPTLTELKNEYGNGFIFQIHKRYGSYVKLCKDLDFNPNFSNHNPKYSREYFLEKAKQEEPSLRIFTRNESRALYKYFKGGINELKSEILKSKVLNTS